MDVLKFTPAQETAHRAISELNINFPDRIHPMFRPMLDLLEAHKTREAADWIDRFRVETLGYPQYRDAHAGTVHLIHVPRRMRTKSGDHFTEQRLTVAVEDNADLTGVPGTLSVWSGVANIDLLMTRGYRIIATVPPRD